MSDLDADPARTTDSAFDRLDALDPQSERARSRTGPSVRDMAPAATAVAPPKLTRRGRLRKWDRPKPPHDWRWWVGNLGKALIATGLLMFGFVGYQLFGTGIETARAQNALESEFDALLAAAPPVAAPDFEAGEGTAIDPTAIDPVVDPESGGDAATDPGDTFTPAPDPTAPGPPVQAVPIEDQNLPTLENGDALARIEIPAINVSDIVVAGVETRDLKKGPGHFPDTPLPGQLGNAAIAGHRTTYGQPFHNVDRLQIGDEIITTTLSGTFTYRVTGQAIVEPSEYQVVATTDPNRATLTLTSCHPKWTARQRIVIFSELVTSESALVGEPILNYGRPAEPTEISSPLISGENPDGSDLVVAGDTTDNGTPEPSSTGGVTGNIGSEPATQAVEPEDFASDAVNEGIADAFSETWFSDPGANPHVGMWGILLALVGIGAYLVSRKLRRDWAGALIGLLPFMITLYFFFQNVNRLLPPNL